MGPGEPGAEHVGRPGAQAPSDLLTLRHLFQTLLVFDTFDLRNFLGSFGEMNKFLQKGEKGKARGPPIANYRIFCLSYLFKCVSPGTAGIVSFRFYPMLGTPWVLKKKQNNHEKIKAWCHSAN